MNKKIIVGSSILLLATGFLYTIAWSSQISNPFIGLKALAQITISNKKAEKITDKPLRYISKSYEDFTEYMEDKGYKVEQYGRGFQIEKGEEARLLVSEGFMGIYEIFAEYDRR